MDFVRRDKCLYRAMARLKRHLVILTAILFCVTLLVTWQHPEAIRHIDKDGVVPPSNLTKSSKNATRRSQCLNTYTLDNETVKKYNKYVRFAKSAHLNNRTDYNILILTPLSDSAGMLNRYFSLLCSLTYPHDRISIALGEDSSKDNTFRKAKLIADQVRPSFRSVSVFKLTETRDRSNLEHDQRHSKNHQFIRRRHLAMARNDLLLRAIKEEHDWIIWLDCDLDYYPPNLIQLLISPNKDIVAPACLYRNDNKRRDAPPYLVYDKNTWRETGESMEYVDKQSRHNKNFLMLEGYENTKRLYLTALRHEGTVVPIDGVGGCTLLVKAAVHRRGLVFPTFIFDSHIETEGLGKMAAKMGIKPYGLPFVSVYHS